MQPSQLQGGGSVALPVSLYQVGKDFRSVLRDAFRESFILGLRISMVRRFFNPVIVFIGFKIAFGEEIMIRHLAHGGNIAGLRRFFQQFFLLFKLLKGGKLHVLPVQFFGRGFPRGGYPVNAQGRCKNAA